MHMCTSELISLYVFADCSVPQTKKFSIIMMFETMKLNFKRAIRITHARIFCSRVRGGGAGLVQRGAASCRWVFFSLTT